MLVEATATPEELCWAAVMFGHDRMQVVIQAINERRIRWTQTIAWIPAKNNLDCPVNRWPEAGLVSYSIAPNSAH